MLTETGIVKHYVNVQIGNSQEKISCAVTHIYAGTHTHTAVPLPSSPAVSGKGCFSSVYKLKQRIS